MIDYVYNVGVNMVKYFLEDWLQNLKAKLELTLGITED